MEGLSGSGVQGALGMQAGMAAGVLSSGAQTPPPPPPAVDSTARAAGLQAQGIGQNLDITC